MKISNLLNGWTNRFNLGSTNSSVDHDEEDDLPTIKLNKVCSSLFLEEAKALDCLRYVSDFRDNIQTAYPIINAMRSSMNFAIVYGVRSSNGGYTYKSTIPFGQQACVDRLILVDVNDSSDGVTLDLSNITVVKKMLVVNSDLNTISMLPRFLANVEVSLDSQTVKRIDNDTRKRLKRYIATANNTDDTNDITHLCKIVKVKKYDKQFILDICLLCLVFEQYKNICRHDYTKDCAIDSRSIENMFRGVLRPTKQTNNAPTARLNNAETIVNIIDILIANSKEIVGVNTNVQFNDVKDLTDHISQRISDPVTGVLFTNMYKLAFNSCTLPNIVL